MSDKPPKRRSLLWWGLGGSAVVIVLAFVGGSFAIAYFLRAMHEPQTPIVDDFWNGGIVVRPGRYTQLDGTVLRVSDKDGLVRFSLTDRFGNALVKEGQVSPSAYSRWHFLLDDKKRLWFYSGDVGTFVWVEKNNTYTMVTLGANDPLVKEMPPEFFAALGSAARREFGHHD